MFLRSVCVFSITPYSEIVFRMFSYPCSHVEAVILSSVIDFVCIPQIILQIKLPTQSIR